ncbi:MAG: starch-binding protein [Muribaculaceae bacterium]|nr:starch-binding protein [Muribaculaceae bacterium]
MKKSLLLIAAGLIMGGSVANAATVYFENTKDWSPVNVYSWTGEEKNAEWPGVEVSETVSSNGKTYYKYESSFENIIFNNGTQQTGDMRVIDNMIYNADGATGNLFGGGSVEIKAEAFLACASNGWSSSNSDYKFTDNGNGTFTYKLAALDEEFKVVYDGKWYGYVDGPMASGVAYPVSSETGYSNCTLESAATNLTFTFDANNLTLKVDYTGEGGVVTPPVADFPEALYLIGGTINGSFWNPAEATAMTKNGNVFEVAAEVSGAEGSADVYFSFLTITGADWDAVNNADRWGAATADEEITFGTPATIVCYPVNVNASSAASYKLTLPSATDVYNCVFTVDFSNNTVKVVNNGITGVAAIVADEAPVYFNLQGVKVAEPTNGIYVKVANGKATKVVINK